MPPYTPDADFQISQSVAVIDLASLINDSKNTNGEAYQCVFSAGDLVAKYGLSLRGNYMAQSEYHVYGRIPPKYG